MRLAAFLMALACACPVGAQSIRASYVEGDAVSRIGSVWEMLSVGDRLPSDASIKLGEGAYVELESPRTKLKLFMPGEYAIGELFSAGRASNFGAVQAALAKCARALSAKRPSSASAVVGVRGAEQGKDDSGWFADDAELFMSAARDYLAMGDYEQAKDQLERAEASALGDEREIRFLLAQAEAAGGKLREAYGLLASTEPAAEDGWALDYHLLKARLLVDSRAPRAAIDELEGSRARLEADSGLAPTCLFLLAVAYSDLGDAESSRRCVLRLQQVAADSELAKAAAAFVN
jgi:hypothetical protein